MSEETFKVYENRLRRMAKRQQLVLQKSARKDPHAYDYGTYQLVTELGDIYFGDTRRGYGMDITEVHRTLLGECVLWRDGCTGKPERAENPYHADVNDSPGIMILACENCLQELSDDI